MSTTRPKFSQAKDYRTPLVVGAVLIIAIVALIALLALRQTRELTEKQTALVTQNMAKSMEQTYDGLIDTIDVAVSAAADEIARQTVPGKVNVQLLNDFLMRQQNRLAKISYIRATDENGDVVLGPGVVPHNVNLADRDFFIRLKNDSNSGLHVGKPIKGRTSDRWVWFFARRINNADGQFGGVVFASIYVDELDKMLASVTLNDGDVATLRDSSLGVIARHVFQGTNPILPGDSRLSASFEAALHADPDEGTYASGATSIDNISRTQSYRRSHKYGYYINVGISNESALGLWNRQLAVVCGLLLALVALVIVLSRTILSNWKQQLADLKSIEEAQEKANYEHEILNSLMDNVPDQIFFKDLQGNFIRINTALATKYGLENPSQAIGKSDLDFYGQAHSTKTGDDERRIMATGVPMLGIVDEEVWPDGRKSWNVCSKLPLYNSKGDLIGTYGIAHDITEQLSTQAKLKEANDSLERRVLERTSELAKANNELQERGDFIRTVTDAVPSLIGYWDRSLRCQFANKMYVDFFNISNDSIMGMHVRDLQGEQFFALCEAHMRLALEGHIQVFEREASRPSGEICYLNAKYIPHFVDEIVQGFYVFAEDITEQKLAEKKLVKLNDDLAVQARVADQANLAKTEFLANMSHEIRTPLSAISGMANLIRKEPLSEAQLDRLGKMDLAVKHLSATVNNILDLSKIEANKLVLDIGPVQIDALFQNVCSMVQDSLEQKRLKLNMEVGPMPRGLVGDSTRLGQALLNYVSNAIKFTDAGMVTMRASMLEESADSARLLVEVQDTGVGIPVENHKKLFDAFVQADSTTTRKYGGSGLGLVITKRFVEAMGGQAGFNSQVGKGSTFWFTVRLGKNLQTSDAANDSLLLNAAHTLKDTHSGKHILLAEDDDFNREIGSLLLQDIGMIVDVAENGQVAVEMATLKDYALVLMDMQMPVLDGLNATRAIRASHTHNAVPIVAMTANAFSEDRIRCLEAGMNDFITKPVDPAVLYATILRIFQR